MSYKLDLKDKKILFILLQNSTIPTNKLAKLVGLSKNSVIYRIKKMREARIIERFHPVLSQRALGMYTHDIFLKYRASETEEKKIREYVKKHPNVVWATTLFGKWDLFVQIVSEGDYTEVHTIEYSIDGNLLTGIEEYDLCQTDNECLGSYENHYQIEIGSLDGIRMISSIVLRAVTDI